MFTTGPMWSNEYLQDGPKQKMCALAFDFASVLKCVMGLALEHPHNARRRTDFCKRRQAIKSIFTM